MRVLVTGGAGYIGSHLVRALLQEGHDVRALDLWLPTPGECCHSRCEFVRGSVSRASLVAQAMKEVEVTYHLAWSFRAGRCHPHRQPDAERREIKHNLTGTANVLQAALLAKVRHLVFCSSAVVYGPTGPARVTEDHVCHPELTALGGPVYGITKLACEKLSLVYQRRGLPVTAFRLHGVFKENRLAQFGTMIRQARGGKALQPVRGAGGEYIHMDDVLTAFLLAMDEPQAQGVVFNLAGSYTYDDVELAQHIVQVTGSRSHVKPLHDPLQSMVSVSVDKLRQRLGFLPQRGEFLTGLIASAFAA